MPQEGGGGRVMYLRSLEVDCRTYAYTNLKEKKSLYTVQPYISKRLAINF